jgi:tetratricopeptide (TPR) repeat protein
MIKRSGSTPDNHHNPALPPSSSSSSEAYRRTPLWLALTLPIAAILIFLLLLEGGLALFGVRPALQTEDPFVGFASNVPLFIPSAGPAGGQIMTTAPNKLGLFNLQSFQQEKASGTFRIFCLGGSTTYGRPYNDATSFSGWLRELLPAADGNKKWEVINVGGISYASYRVAHLMEELVHYQPDLFIIYTGHNEFLEERTYSQIRDIPPVIRSAVSLLARTRTWSAMTAALQRLGIQHPQAEPKKREQLRGEVNAILDRSAGLNRYNRDDPLRENILEHYRISLERMVALARSAGAKIIFVAPASNLKDCTPFKSEHTPGLDPAKMQRSEQILAQAKEDSRQGNWKDALDLLETAVAFDPRYAELQYRRGQALLVLGRFDEAEVALRLARDEDVCPLRALTPMRLVVTEIAREQGVGLVDYAELLAQRMQETQGHRIPGKESFLDHVHPTIEGHKILAVALLRAMIEQGLVNPGSDWGEQAIAAVAAKIEGGINQRMQAQALINLARVLLWAGKTEDAARLAEQALAKAGGDQKITKDINATLAKVYQKQGEAERALQVLYSAIEKAPASVELHYMLGMALIEDGPHMQLEEAAANLLLVCKQMPYDDLAYQYFGLAMAKRDRMRVAHASLLEARRINPKNLTVKKALAEFPPLPGDQAQNLSAPSILLDVYPSRAPRRLVQVRHDSSGRVVPDGIEVEFYENGRLKRFLDIDLGVPNGLGLTWDSEGRQLSQVEYRQGKAVDITEGDP